MFPKVPSAIIVGLLAIFILQDVAVSQPVSDPLWRYFAFVAGPDAVITGLQLRQALSRAGMGNFDEATGALMITMVDKNYSGKMNFAEFKQLWDTLTMWKSIFTRFDASKSGTLSPVELAQAWGAAGLQPPAWSNTNYKLNANVYNQIFRKFGAPIGRLSLNEFVHASILLKMHTDFFRYRDVQRNGMITITYDDFIMSTMM